MNTPIIQRRVVKSISEFSVFKIALVSYLIIFILTVIFAAISALIMQTILPILGNIFNNFIGASGAGSLLSLFGINIPNASSLGSAFGGIVTSGPAVIVIVGGIIGGLLFSVVFAAIAAFWTWIFNVVIKISGGIEIRYIDRTINTESKNTADISTSGGVETK
jgi:hypothetical protein